ncbi:MAG: hypothetical protein ACREM2_09570, partial [Vulcanimicrobiaceae bacterium]
GPAQILKIRVDGAGPHLIAGLMLSGERFHAPLDPARFSNEVIALTVRSFAALPLEEVDVWAVVPIAVPRGSIVSGDLAIPTERIVYSATVRRAEGPAFAARLRRGDDVFWDPRWRAALAAPDRSHLPRGKQAS